MLKVKSVELNKQMKLKIPKWFVFSRSNQSIFGLQDNHACISYPFLKQFLKPFYLEYSREKSNIVNIVIRRIDSDKE